MNKSSAVPILFTLFLLLGPCSVTGQYMPAPKQVGDTMKFTAERILLGELTPYRTCFDVNYYDLSLEILPSKKSLDGIVEIHAQALENFDTLQIDLHKKFEITQLIDLQTKLPLNYTRRERAVFVQLSKKKNENFILKIAYKGKPLVAKNPPWEGGFVWKKDNKRNHWVGVACETDGASVWWPLKDHTADEPDSMRLHYTVPKGLMAVGNGQFEGKMDANEKTTYNWFISYPINTYNVSVYVGKFRKIEAEYIGINGKVLSISHYVLNRNYERAKSHFKQLQPQLKFFEKRFGEYPWYNDGFKLIESPYAGMEHQTAIAYGSGYVNDLDAETDHIILHETAHEWWGNSVTAKDLAHVWLQEGFATYSEALYLEEKHGLEAYMRQLYVSRFRIKNQYPVVVEEGKRWFDAYQNSDVYGKGAWILHSLRMQINNDLVFFDILKTFAERYRHKIVESKDFVALVNEKTASDYNWFFNHYLYDKEVPLLKHTISSKGILYYQWANTTAEFNQLKLRLKLKTQNQAITIIPSNEIQRLSLPKGKNGGWNYLFLGDILYSLESAPLLISETK